MKLKLNLGLLSVADGGLARLRVSGEGGSGRMSAKRVRSPVQLLLVVRIKKIRNRKCRIGVSSEEKAGTQKV
jgi:hypothetical protein